MRQTRRGKGNALAAGFEAATCDIIVMIDADGPCTLRRSRASWSPWPGAPTTSRGPVRHRRRSDDITALRKAGNWGLNVLTNVLFRSRYTDLCYGYNAFTRECVDAFTLARRTRRARCATATASRSRR